MDNITEEKPIELPVKPVETVPGSGERTKQSDMEADCERIKGYWANGVFDSAVIKKMMGLNKAAYHQRLQWIAQDEHDHKDFTWLMFLNKKQLRYQKVREIREQAAVIKERKKIDVKTGKETIEYSQPNLNVMLGCERLMNEMDEQVIDIGQRLGMINPSVPDSSMEAIQQRWMNFLGIAPMKSNGNGSSKPESIYIVTSEIGSKTVADSGQLAKPVK